MIALLTGQLASRSPEQIILDVAGVGYRLQIPLSTFYALPDEGKVQLQVYTHVKEDAINLFGLVAGLTYLLRNKIKDALANRALGVRKDIDSPNKARKDATLRFEELESRLAGFEDELSKMKSDAEAAAKTEHAAIIARAEDDAIRLAEAAKRSIVDETIRARQALRKEVALLSIDIARDKLKAALNADDELRLAGNFMSTVKDHNGGSNG
jgi:F0F1-type ATP synthase membrane subunit b/b'